MIVLRFCIEIVQKLEYCLPSMLPTLTIKNKLESKKYFMITIKLLHNCSQESEINLSYKKIPHTGDTESLDRCGS